MERPLYCRTPLIDSVPLSHCLHGVTVYLKLENTQPVGSFKQRGLSRLCQHAVAMGHTTVVTSSGGNAGLAVAYTARKLGIRAKVFVTERTPQSVIEKLEREGADVTISGDVWDQSDMAAKEFVLKEGGFYCHPFDDPIVWSGHASMVAEIREDLGFQKPCAVVTCVGGGGLLCGVLQGLHEVGWQDVPVVAMETEGAASYTAACREGRPVTLDAMTSVAVTLGALRVCRRSVEYLKEHAIYPEVVSDKEAVDACFRFADDHRMLVEPSCGAALASFYSGVLSRLIAEKKIAAEHGPLVAIVCGGSAASFNNLQKWRDFVQQKKQ